MVESDQQRLRLRHHDMPRLATTIAKHGSEVVWHEAFHLLLVPIGGCHANYCVADAADPWRPCEAAQDPVDPFTALTSQGGFAVH